jgi:cardiolipin synthase
MKGGQKEHVRVPRWVFWFAISVLVILSLLLWSIAREPQTHLRVENPGELRTLMPSLVGLTQSSLDPGNRIEVLQNGDQFFPAMLRDIAGARETVHFETFIWYDGSLSRRLAALLAQKARSGVEVRLLVDASGGKDLDGAELEMLRAAGAKVAHFHPFRISNLGRLNNRDHRKVTVIDGTVGYVGGFGIADEWLGDARHRKEYRDTGFRITGPLVSRLQAAFSENWIEETGEIPAGERYFPKQQPAGTVPGHAAYTSPTGSISSVQILHYLALEAARKEILIQNPYLLPDHDAIEALEKAVARGVSVRIMVPSVGSTDSSIVQHASHHHFGTLLERGVRIWEYERTLLHQKVLVVDGIWSVVGSTNFDDRSFQLNDELSVGVLDAGVAAQLRAAFASDLRFAREMRLEPWKKRPWRHKLMDGLAYLARPQL